MTKRFILEYWKDEGWYVGKLKEVPGVFSQGKTLKQLEENIKDAYKLIAEEENLPGIEVKTKEIGIEV